MDALVVHWHTEKKDLLCGLKFYAYLHECVHVCMCVYTHTFMYVYMTYACVHMHYSVIQISFPENLNSVIHVYSLHVYVYHMNWNLNIFIL